MSAKQNVIGAAGAGLLAVNFWTGPGRASITKGISSKATTKERVAAHDELVRFGAALLLLGGATVVAGVSDTWGSVMVTAILGLWLLWLINRFGK